MRASLAAATFAILCISITTAASPATPFYQPNLNQEALQLHPEADTDSSLWDQSLIETQGLYGASSDGVRNSDIDDEHDEFTGKKQGWVYLIRHGEKVKKSDKTGLSERGILRAKCLMSVFGRSKAGVTYPIDYILSQDFKASGQRRRPYETVKPLSKLHGIKLNHKCDRDDTKCAVRKIKNKTRAGKNVLVVWEHARLSKIASALGVSGLVYPSERYDIIFKIRGKKVHSIVSERCEGLDEEWMHWKSEKKGKHGKSPRGGRLIDDESWADDATLERT